MCREALSLKESLKTWGKKKSSGRLTPQIEEDARLKHDSHVRKVRI